MFLWLCAISFILCGFYYIFILVMSLKYMKSNDSISPSDLNLTSQNTTEKLQHANETNTTIVTNLQQEQLCRQTSSEASGFEQNCHTDSSADVFGNNVPTDNTDFVSEEISLTVELSLTNDNIKHIERQLTKHERVSTAFLFFNDTQLALKYCHKSLSSYKFKGLTKYTKDMSSPLSSAKLLECLFLLKNYFLLEKYGLDKHAAKKVFTESSNINQERLVLFSIFESLTQNEAKMLMDSISTLPNEEYLEVFFLKLTEPKQWITISEVMHSFNNPNYRSLITNLNEVIVNKQMEKISINTIYEPKESGLLDSDFDAYPIKDPNNVGIALIINQEKFQRLPTRVGTDKDVTSLYNVLKSLKFEVKIINNQPLKFFGRQLEHFITEYFKEYHSIFFMVILSHGAEGSIYSSDDKPVSIEKNIYSLLNSVPNLKNIPKVLIIQACQGEKFLISDKVSTDGADSLTVTTDMNSELPNLKNLVGEYISDAFIVMSTVPGFKSFRIPETGSYFIQSLSQCIQKYQNNHIYDIITEVMKQVDNEVVASKFEGLNFGQQPICNSLLKRKLYLKPFKQNRNSQ